MYFYDFCTCRCDDRAEVPPAATSSGAPPGPPAGSRGQAGGAGTWAELCSAAFQLAHGFLTRSKAVTPKSGGCLLVLIHEYNVHVRVCRALERPPQATTSEKRGCLEVYHSVQF